MECILLPPGKTHVQQKHDCNKRTASARACALGAAAAVATENVDTNTYFHVEKKVCLLVTNSLVLKNQLDVIYKQFSLVRSCTQSGGVQQEDHAVAWKIA